jgi:UDP-glucuronate 4-epimerase
MAAQPGVRYSLVNPAAYLRNNVDAFGAVLEGCRHGGVEHLVYASSSSVYGANHTLPFSEDQNVDHPVSLYAATKKANELMAHSYSHLYRMPRPGCAFSPFTGLGAAGHVADAVHARHARESRPIKVFNYGRMQRDFTHRTLSGLSRVFFARPPVTRPQRRPSAIYNIGNHTAVELEPSSASWALLGVRAIRVRAAATGDVPATFASIRRLAAATGFAPSTRCVSGCPLRAVYH